MMRSEREAPINAQKDYSAHLRRLGKAARIISSSARDDFISQYPPFDGNSIVSIEAEKQKLEKRTTHTHNILPTPVMANSS